MKKEMFVFLCVAAALFFGSCTDLSMDNEKAVKADLPSDFDWEKYAEINNDVKMSQIILELKKTKRGEDSIAHCVNILSDIDFAKEIYENYLQCPMEGWDKNEKCTGKYANNSNYTKSTIVRDTTITEIVDPEGMPKLDTTITIDTIWWCAIETCWSGGWSEMKDFLPDSLAKYSETSKTDLDVIKAMCQFIPDSSTLEGAKEYLREFVPDSYLVEQHYHFFGRSDGRPYRECPDGHGEPKTQNLPAVIRLEGRVSYYYDYGCYTFCLDKDDIYVMNEVCNE